MVDLLPAPRGGHIALKCSKAFFVCTHLTVLGPLSTTQQLIDDAAERTEKA